MVSGIRGGQGKYSSCVGGSRVLDGEITEIFWVATKIKGQGPGLVNVLSQREWLRVDQFQYTHG